MNRRSGRVLVVGAGSGSAGNLTLDAADAIRSGDVVVYDRLVPSGVLEHARPDARLVYAGKAPGKHAMSQDEINRLLVEEASRGRTVVRLKGGDPLFYGRGEEECLYVRRHGLECRVIPGVPSPFAAAARFLIPLAGRGFSSSVAFTTGTIAGGSPLPTERIRGMLSAVDTVVFMMATRLYPTIVRATVDVRGPGEVIAVVEDLGGRRERLIIGRAKDPSISGHRPEPPAIIIVGGSARWALEHASGLFW